MTVDPPVAPRPVAAIVLAAGAGTRMKSARPKVLHELAGRSMLGHALAAVEALDPQHLVVVVRHERDAVAAHTTDLAPHALIADQDEIPGTGRAVQCGLAVLPAPPSGMVIVTYGDVPMLTADTLTDLLRVHAAQRNAITVITADKPDPTGYGRIVRDADGLVEAIVEHRDATDEIRQIREINSGLYVFDGELLSSALTRVGRGNDQGEVYLTDVLSIARSDGHRVAAHHIDALWQTEGVNDRVQLSAMATELNRRLIIAHQLDGVTVIDPASTRVDVGVELARDVTLLPGTALHGTTRVGEGATIGPDTSLTDCVVGAGAEVIRSHGSGAVIDAEASVGPFSFLRPGTRLGSKGKIGAFVETKNVTIGVGSKVPHLSYAGDADIGDGVNIGAATVFVNYDGVNKHRSTVCDHARVGSDTMLVAPVTIGAGAYTAAGSVITENVPPGAMGVGRTKQRNIAGWVIRRRAGSPAAVAAQAAAERGDGQTEGEGAGR